MATESNSVSSVTPTVIVVSRTAAACLLAASAAPLPLTKSLTEAISLSASSERFSKVPGSTVRTAAASPDDS